MEEEGVTTGVVVGLFGATDFPPNKLFIGRRIFSFFVLETYFFITFDFF